MAPITEKSLTKPLSNQSQRTRARELDAAISSITKLRRWPIMRLGDAQAHVKIDVIPTGALALDLAWRGWIAARPRD